MKAPRNEAGTGAESGYVLTRARLNQRRAGFSYHGIAARSILINLALFRIEEDIPTTRDPILSRKRSLTLIRRFHLRN